MKPLAIAVIAAIVLLCAAAVSAADNQLSLTQKMNQTPLSFTKNMGQWDERVLFRANAGGATMWFTKEGVTYQFTRTSSRRGDPMGRPDQIQPKLGESPTRPYDPDECDSIEQLVLTAKFIGANRNPEVIAEGQMEYKCNYFLGNDPSKWHTDVPNYEAITLKDIYPGIDLKYSGRRGNGQATYEFVVAQGADIAQIKVEYDGAEATAIDASGNLVLKTKWGDMIAALDPTTSSAGLALLRFVGNSEKAPNIAAGNQSLSELGSGTLSLAYSTLLGGNEEDKGFAIAIDEFGCAYATGRTASLSFPTHNAYDSSDNGNWDVFVTRISASGSSLVYSTYLGGKGFDSGFGIIFDSLGCAYVAGETTSSDFPTQRSYDCSYNGRWDVFVTKLSVFGDSLVYSTYLGGSSDDCGQGGIKLDASRCAYVGGFTRSANFPTQNAYDSSHNGNWDVFVTKLSASGNSLFYSTYLGGSDPDWGGSIRLDSLDCAIVTGETKSSNFPTKNAYDNSYNGKWDVFVTKISAAGDSLVYSTYLGGSDDDRGFDIAVDSYGSAYATGYTASSDFPTWNAYDSCHNGGSDAFVTKFSAAGNSLVYSTYLGGSSDDGGWGITVDGSGCAYVTGWAGSSDFPSQNAYDSVHNGGFDAFVAMLSATGSSQIYDTFLGGSTEDFGVDVAVRDYGCVYVTGWTQSPDFPTQNPYQTYQGSLDAFVTKLTWTPDYSCGDVNTDEQVDLLDAVFLINYIFVGGSAPQQLSLADVDCSGRINIADVVRLINYIFSGGPAPCAACK